MSEYNIEKGIPIPDLRVGTRRSLLNQMEIGDSVFFDGQTSRRIAGNFSILAPKRFVCRQLTENDIKGVRVWRVE